MAYSGRPWPFFGQKKPAMVMRKSRKTCDDPFWNASVARYEMAPYMKFQEFHCMHKNQFFADSAQKSKLIGDRTQECRESRAHLLPRTLGIGYHVIFHPFLLFLLSGRDSSIIFFQVLSPVFPLHPLTSRFVMSSHPRM